jgi:hypothetical protein
MSLLPAAGGWTLQTARTIVAGGLDLGRLAQLDDPGAVDLPFRAGLAAPHEGGGAR